MKIIADCQMNILTKKVTYKLTVTDGERKEVIYKGKNASEAKLIKQNMEILINGNHLTFTKKRLKIMLNTIDV